MGKTKKKYKGGKIPVNFGESKSSIGNRFRHLGSNTRNAVKTLGHKTRKVFNVVKGKIKSHSEDVPQYGRDNLHKARKTMDRTDKKYIFFLKKISNLIDYYKGLYCSVKFFNKTICSRLNSIMKNNIIQNTLYIEKKNELFSEIDKIRKVIIEKFPEHENAIKEDIETLKTDIETNEKLFDDTKTHDELIDLDSIIHASLDKEVDELNETIRGKGGFGSTGAK